MANESGWQQRPTHNQEDRIMATLRPWIDTFERMMAAVAFAEHNDRETAIWILKSDSRRPSQRISEEAKKQTPRRPELRL
jgi:hypothetical protein